MSTMQMIDVIRRRFVSKFQGARGSPRGEEGAGEGGFWLRIFFVLKCSPVTLCVDGRACGGK